MADDKIISPEGMQEFLDPETQAQEQLISPDAMVGLIDGTDTTGQLRRNVLAGQLAAMKGRIIDEQEIELAEQQFDPSAALAVQAEEIFQNLERAVAENSLAAIHNNPADPAAVVADTNDGMNHVNDLRGHPTAEELATIQNATTIPLVAAVHEQIAFQLGARNELMRMVDEQGMLDFILDLGGMFIPTRHTKEWEDIKNNIGSHKKLGQFLTGDSIASMIGSWQALPLARKRALWPTLVEVIRQSTGIEGGPIVSGNLTDTNTQLAVAALIRFLQPEGASRASLEQKALLGFDILAFAPLGQTGKASRQASAFNFGKKGLGAKPSPTTKPRPTGARRPTPDEPFPRTDPSEGVTVEGEVVGKVMGEVNDLPEDVRKAMEGVMLDAANMAMKRDNIIRLLAQAGDTPQAARATVGAMESESIRRTINISTDDAITNAMPFQTKEWLPQAVEGLVPDIAQEINHFLRMAEGKVRSMTTESDLLRIGALAKSDRTRVMNSFLKEMDRVGEDYLMEGIHLSNVKIVHDDAAAFEFEYTLTNATGFGEAFKGRRSWGINQVTGNFEETVTELATKPIIPGTSPAAWSIMGAGDTLDFGNTVKQSIQLEDIAVASKAAINELWIDANASISGLRDIKARQRVEAVELAGDEFINPETPEKGRTFSSRELATGINTAMGTVRLTNPNEVLAYNKRRIVADAFHSMENFVARRELELAQMKLYTFDAAAGEQQLFVKPFATLGSATQSIANKPGFGVYNTFTRQIHDLSPEFLEEAYDKGLILGRLRADWNTSGNALSRGGEHVEYVLIDPNLVQQLPEQVLNYKFGYVPKINLGVEFIVVRNYAMTKRGTVGRIRTEALRAFSSRKDADKFIELLAQRTAVKQSIAIEDARLLFSKKDGSVMGQLERMENSLSGSAGLFRGERSVDDILMGLNGVPMERMSPSEAYGRYIDHLGTKVAKNEWVIGKEKEWMNSVRKTLPEVRIEGFNGTRLPNTPEGQALEKLRGQINKWNSVPSRKEGFFAANIQTLHDWTLEGSRRHLGIEKQNIKSILWLKHSDPAAAMMASNMHIFLGVLNPSQLFVQASAITVALSLAPIAAIPNILATSAMFATLDGIRNMTALGKVAKQYSKMSGVNPDFDSEMYMLWRRSGLQESVRSNADMNYMSNTGLGITNDVLRKADNFSLYIYRAGELMNRRVSFITAYTLQRKALPSTKPDDDFLSGVLQQANLFMLELNAAQKAWWQGGVGANAVQKILANTTQFQQVLAKTLELTIKGERRGGFSLRQKARIAAGQWLVFGATGVPILSMVGPAFVDWVSDVAGLDDGNPEDVATKQSIANIYNQGFSGWFAHEVMGAKVEVATRAGLAIGVIDTATDMLTSEDPMWLKLMGVGGVTLQRAGQAASVGLQYGKSVALAEMGKLEPFFLADRRGNQDITKEQWLAVLADMSFLALQLPSSFRNIYKAHLMEQGVILDGRGRVKIRAEFDQATILAVMGGFQPSRESRLRAVQKDRRYYDELIAGYADMIVAAQHRLVYLWDNDPAHADSVRLMTQGIQTALGNDFLVEQLRSAIIGRIYDNPQTTEQRELLEFFHRTASDKITQGLILDRAGIFGGITDKQAVVIPFADTLKGTQDAGDK